MNDKAKLITKYKIETERLNLLPVVDNDVADIFRFMSNPNTTDLLSSLKPHESIKDTKTLIDTLSKFGIRSHLWAIRIETVYYVIGLVHFFLLEKNKAEIHYILAEEFWNKGLTTEAVNSILSWACSIYPQLRIIGSYVTEANIASCRVLEKCGFKIVNRRCVRSSKSYPFFVNMVYYQLNLD